MTSTLYTFLIQQQSEEEPITEKLLYDAHALGFTHITQFECHDLYFLQGNLNPTEQQKIVRELFSDPITQRCDILDEKTRVTFAQKNVVEVLLRPGVTDPIAEEILHGTRLLNINSIQRVATGKRYVVHAQPSIKTEELHTLTARLLANSVIHHYHLGKIETIFPVINETPAPLETIALRSLNNDELQKLSWERRAALDLTEMQAIQQYFRSIDRDPTDVEFETIAQTWSEHCSHKTFRADIQYEGKTIHGLLKTYIRAATETINAPWVWSAFVDNAGIIDFDDDYQLAFKVETHNHPSAIEPFGGANTGVGGVIRDILGVSAKPIANTDILCFGPQEIKAKDIPENTLHPRLIRSGVIAGVQDYGNKTGIPTVNGTIWYDAGYTANPLVYCGCVGLIPKNKHVRNPQPGDHVIILGGRTGRDGLRGATFSSMTMDAQTGEVAGASVQIGDPIIAKGLIDVITKVRDAGLYNAITDCGAGGLSSAVGEMGSGIGADVDIQHVRLKYPGLAAWEIWLSEAQERMVLAVPSPNIASLQKICDQFDIELTDIGKFTDSGELIVRLHEKIVLQLSNEFLHDGMPKKTLIASKPIPLTIPTPEKSAPSDPSAMLLKLLAHPNIASKADVIHRYDHEVQGATVVKPLTGAENDGPSDACVLKPLDTKGIQGLVLANGLNPEFGKYDAYAMAYSVIDEAIRNAVAVGADPSRIAILDNFCWGDPKRPETLGALVDASRGCHDAAVHYQTPFISGKDSLNNEYIGTDNQRHAIPPTLLISALGIIPDIHRAVTMDFKSAGNKIYLIGETKNELLGSHFLLCDGYTENHGTLPNKVEHAPALYRQLHAAMKEKYIRACHDLSEGGLAVALAEMCIGGRLGCHINIDHPDLIAALFSESNGRFLVEVPLEQCSDFEKHFAPSLSHFLHLLGEISDEPQLIIRHEEKNKIVLSIEELIQAAKK